MDQGSRIYDVAGYRLPSVTTIVGKTKNQQFLKDWKAKVGEAEAERIKNLSSKEDRCICSRTLYTRHWPMILQGLTGGESHGRKSIEIGLFWKSIMARKLRCIILLYAGH